MAILMNRNALKHTKAMRCIAAPRTYNPLGNTLTFLNLHDIVQGVSDIHAL
jgi:hypothetical protein